MTDNDWKDLGERCDRIILTIMGILVTTILIGLTYLIYTTMKGV